MTKINLHGEWNFQLDKDKQGLNNELYKKELNDTITLPTTTSEAKKGEINTDREVGYLTDLYKFEGFAWFSKEVEFPNKSENDYIELIMERTRITHLWIDDNYVGTYNSLCTSHHYDITPYVNNNKHKVTIMVDNTSYPTKGGHMTSPDTQTNWNGITGEISIKITNKTRLSNVKFYPNIEDKSVIVRGNILGNKIEKVSLTAFDEIKVFDKKSYNINNNSFEVKYLMGEDVQLWSEYNPHTYKMKIQIQNEEKVINEDTYSFVMMSLGNELWGSKETLNSILKGYKEYDNRHLYVQGCNNFQWAPCILEEDDFFSGVRFTGDRLYRGSYAMCDAPQGHIQTDAPNTIHNYDEIIRPTSKKKSSAGEVGVKQIQYGTGVKEVLVSETEEFIPKVPVISHEIGQYETFPNFKEIDKYTGVLKARNFEVFKERLEEKGLIDKADMYFKASGKLAAECYKGELETAFRSNELAGFQLLDLQDFSGQGTALVGILDAFMDNKGIISSEEWREFCSDCILLGEFSKYVWDAGEKFNCNIKLTNYRKEIKNCNMVLKIELVNETSCLWKEEVIVSKLAIGVNNLSTVSFQLPKCEVPQKYTFKLTIEDLDILNHYELWVYPIVPELDKENIIITDDLLEVISGVSNNKKILYYPKEEENINSIEGTYCTDFWCYPMFRSISESMGKPIPVGTMGLLINDKHPALMNFPCEFYSTPQWWDIIMNSRLSILDNVKIDPIVQMIDNFERNHLLGLVYEFKVNEAKILVCNSPLKEIVDSSPAEWLQYSLIKYMESKDFKPEKTIRIDTFNSIFNSK